MTPARIGLGDHVRDTISGWTGVVVAKSEYLNGCVKYCVEAHELDGGKMMPEYWLDAYRIVVTNPRQPEAQVEGFRRE